jgi:hypothetical protein
MEILSQYMVEQFVNRAVIHLRTAFPGQIKEVSDTYLRGKIHSGIDKARQYNINFEEDVLRYLEYIIEYGTDFDINPDFSWAGKILMDDIDGSAKIALLDEYVRSELKEEIWS